MSVSHFERRAWQTAVAILALIPVGAGMAGVLYGPRFISPDLPAGNLDLDSHFRYLSGLLTAIGFAFWATVKNPEKNLARFGGLTCIVFIGGLARLMGFFVTGKPSLPMAGGLLMELVVTPQMFLWQLRLARKAIVSKGMQA